MLIDRVLEEYEQMILGVFKANEIQAEEVLSQRALLSAINLQEHSVVDLNRALESLFLKEYIEEGTTVGSYRLLARGFAALK